MNTLSRTYRSILFPLLLSAVAACGEGGVEPVPDVATASVAVSAAAPGMQEKQSVQLSAEARNAAGSALAGKSFTWTSSSDAVATVSASGVVTGNAAGSVTITATETASSRSGTVTLSVTPTPVAALEVLPAALSLVVGGTRELTITARDAAGNALAGRTVALVSSNGAVATVSGSTVTAVAPGTATLTATVGGKSATATVTVTAVLAGPATGVYRLRMIGTEPLPYALPYKTDARGTRLTSLMSETLRLDADGTYRIIHTEDRFLGTSFDSAGSYKVINDSSVELSGGRRVTVSRGVAAIESCVDGRTCRYVRDGADGGPDLTYRIFDLAAYNGAPLSQGGADVSGGRVWLWESGRYRRNVTVSGLPGAMTDDGTYAVSGTRITLTPGSPLETLAGRRPLSGTYAGDALSLGVYGYAPATLP